MPCRVDICTTCNHYDCECQDYGWYHRFDTAGALCDVIKSMAKGQRHKLPEPVRRWWSEHRRREIAKGAK